MVGGYESQIGFIHRFPTYKSFMNLFTSRAFAIFFLLVFQTFTPLLAQSGSEFWTQAKPATSRSATPARPVKKADYYLLEFEGLAAFLKNAPKEKAESVRSYGLVVMLPAPGGKMMRFRLAAYDAMEAKLAERFPQIRTYYGSGVDEPAARVFLDVTPTGFHARMFVGSELIYIDPVFKGDVKQYQVYNRKDLISGNTQAGCSTHKDHQPENLLRNPGNQSTQSTALALERGAQRRIYRIAVAGTKEFTDHYGSKENALGAIVVLVNTANALYEKDLAIRFVLVANNEQLVFTQEPDPYDNGNYDQMLSANSGILKSRIGAANFDLGLVLCSTGGGVAHLGVVCGEFKGDGVANGTDNIWDFHFVHEIGHQFNAGHTWSGSLSGCIAESFDPANAVEPGSGITVMSYGGACDLDNVSTGRYMQFHNFSQRTIQEYITTGLGSTCGTVQATGNFPPSVVSISPQNSTIPISTPYQLQGAAADLNGDAVELVWEQVDLAPTQRSINQIDLTNGPLTRSFRSSKTGGIRTVPSLESLSSNQPKPGDNLGTVSRQMNFRLTGRDLMGGTRDQTYSFSVTADAGPFVVNFPAGGERYVKNQPMPVFWTVAGTNLPPVNCQKVYIRMSIDGGLTYPYLLANQIANDGFETVMLPNVVSDSCRIQVGSIGNIFFNINPGNFSVDHCRGTSVCNDGGLERHFMTRIEMGSINQTSGCGSQGYTRYKPAKLPGFSPDQMYTLKATLGSQVFNQALGVWVDYNDDGDFDDASEFVASAGPSSFSISTQLQFIGASYAKGSRRLRIRCRPAQTFTAGESCTNMPYGETEDYQIRIEGYCFENSQVSDATFGNHYISNVSLAGWSNASTSNANGYTNFVDSVATALIRPGSQQLVVETVNESPIGVGVWLDVNNDGDFADAGEFLGSSAPNLVNATQLALTFPELTVTGSDDGLRRLRIRAAYNATFSGAQYCTSGAFGETEDYQIRIGSYCVPAVTCNGVAANGIGSFSLAGISNNQSSCPAKSYTSFPETAFLGKMALGVPYSGLVFKGANTKYLRIWMDLNEDFDFQDEGELLVTQTFIEDPIVFFSITLPYNYQFIGKRRLRVALVNATNQDVQACVGDFDGEVQDYVVEVSEALSLQAFNPNFCQGQTIEVPYTLNASVPAGTGFNVYLSDETGDFGNGQLIGSGTSSPITCQIPDAAPFGFGYRIRLQASSIPNLEVTSPNSEYHVYPMPKIVSIVPMQAAVGSQVVLNGSFAQVEQVNFQNTVTQPDSISADGSRLYVTVPTGAESGEIRVFTEFCQAAMPGFQVGVCSAAISILSTSPASSPDCHDGRLRVQANVPGRILLYRLPGLLVDSLSTNDTLRATFSGLHAGTHRLIFISNGACKDSLVNDVSAQACNLSALNISSTGSNAGNGKIEFDFVSGNCSSPVFTLYKMVGGNFQLQVQQPVLGNANHYSYANLSAGQYQWTIQSGSCSILKSATVDSLSLVLAKPEISPGTGTFSEAQLVQISCSTPGVTLYYTTSGNVPVVGTGFTRLYSGPFTVTQSTTIRAMAVKTGSANSPVAVAVLTFAAPVQVSAPGFSLPAGTYSGPQTLAMQTATSGASIYYTTNGNTPLLSVPNTFTRLYTGPILLTSSCTVKAIAVKTGLPQSAQTTTSYSILASMPTVEAPVISPGSGTYGGPVSVSISSATSGAEIYYTTNGNTPLLSVPNYFTRLYTGPFTMSAQTTIRAIATHPGMTNSATTVAVLRFAPGRMALENEEDNARSGNLWTVYPNPSETGEFTLHSMEENSGEVQIAVYSSDGRKILERSHEGSVDVHISLREFQGSIFLLQIRSAAGIKTLTLVK